jgi:RimJ/RimL family protein N-acetyltransferase
MGNGPALTPITITQVPPNETASAFLFHKRFTAGNPYIWARTEADFEKYAGQGALFAARDSDTQEVLGLCYIATNDDETVWEFGGLMVSPRLRKTGIANILARFAIAYSIAFDSVILENRFVAHVHEENQDPRHLLEKLGFVHDGRILAPPNAPTSMKRNEQGEVWGDEFHFSTEGIKKICRWLNEEFTGSLANGAPVVFNLQAGTFEEIKDALSGAAARLELGTR